MSAESPCAWTEERIEAYTDGELESVERLRLEEHAAHCPTCSAQLEEARRLVAALRALPRLNYPATAEAALKGEIRRLRRGRLLTYTRRLSAAAAVLLALLGGHILFEEESPPPAFEAEEIAQARRQVEWTLAYLGNLGNRTGAAVRDDVIQPRLVAPLRQSLETILPASSM